MQALPEKKVIGLTGSIGSGKSTLGHYLAKDYPVLDLDEVNRHLDAQKLLGSLYQEDMATRFFQDGDYKKQVEAILHPAILAAMQEWMASQRTLCFVEVPLLFELGWQVYFDETWLVWVDQKVALQRLQEFRHISQAEAKARLVYQMPVSRKKVLATYSFENNQEPEKLYEQVERRLAWLHTHS